MNGGGSASQEDEEEEQILDLLQGWTFSECTRDNGNCYFHTRLREMLKKHYGHYRVGIEYCLEKWEHPRYPTFWKGAIRIRRSSLPL